MRGTILLLSALLCLPLALADDGATGATTTPGPVHADGTRLQIVLPATRHMRNTGGNDLAPNRLGVPTNPGRVPGKGSGLCVFTSIEMSADLQNVPTLIGLQKWMTRKPGGGWPQKVDEMLTAFCREKGVPVPAYIQVEGRDLDILRLATKTGRMPGITAGYLPGYSGRIAHMVNLAHAGPGGWYAVLDNNYPGRWAWLTETELMRSYTAHGNGWAVILLSPPPPPAPKE